MEGQFCLVLYNGNAYPCKVLKVDINDDDALVQCMCRIGANNFFGRCAQTLHGTCVKTY